MLPRVGFSIDAFGHSSLTPYLFKALGLEALLVYRMPFYLYEGLARRNQYFFTWEGDHHERIRTYRLKDYAIIEKFNLDHISGTCFIKNDTCAELFIENHIDH